MGAVCRLLGTRGSSLLGAAGPWLGSGAGEASPAGLDAGRVVRDAESSTSAQVLGAGLPSSAPRLLGQDLCSPAGGAIPTHHTPCLLHSTRPPSLLASRWSSATSARRWPLLPACWCP